MRDSANRVLHFSYADIAERADRRLSGVAQVRAPDTDFNPDSEHNDWLVRYTFDKEGNLAEVVNRAGYASPVRTPRGRDILAACGQLKSESVKLRARDRAGAAEAEGH